MSKAKNTLEKPSSSRSRTLERRKEKQAEQRRQQQLTIAVALVVVAVIAIIMVILANQPAEAIIPEGLAARYEGITATVNEDGYPMLGNPDAPVQVVEYSSFSCSACAIFHDAAHPSLVERARAGEINLTFVPISLTGSVPNARGAAQASACALEQNAFWEYHDVLFDWHTRYGNQAFSANRLSSGISALGLDLNAYNTCLGSGRAAELVSQADAEGVTSTPTVRVDGVDVVAQVDAINARIDERLAFAGSRGTDTTPTATEDATPDAQPEGEITPEADTPAEATPEATP